MSSYKATLLERVEFELPAIKAEKLPLIIDDWTLAFRLGFRGKTFWFIHKNRDKQYKEFKIKKASGGLRTIHNPSPLMRVFSQQLRARVLLPLCARLGQHVAAYQLGKSTVDAAREHVLPCEVCAPFDGLHTCEPHVEVVDEHYAVKKRECVACQMPPKHDCPRHGVKIHMDIKDFFGSTRRSWIRQYFHDVVGYNHYVSALLAHFMTVTLKNAKTKETYNGVPQGSKTSGDICNLIADHRFDQELLKKFPDWRYTRYADDLYFSHPKNLPINEVNEFIKAVEAVVQASGYRINRKKLHVQRPHRRQRLLGVVLNQKVNIPREQFRQMRSLLHNCVNEGFEAQVKRAKKDNVFHMHHWIRGKLAYFMMIAPARAQHLKAIYEHAREKHLTDNEQKYMIP
jgi:hypothetical protein